MIRALWILLPIVAVYGCSSDRAVRCEDDARYHGARSAAPIRIPDDLSIPDESEAIRVPPRSANASASREPGQCLESPPDFFQSGRS